MYIVEICSPDDSWPPSDSSLKTRQVVCLEKQTRKGNLDKGDDLSSLGRSWSPKCCLKCLICRSLCVYQPVCLDVCLSVCLYSSPSISFCVYIPSVFIHLLVYLFIFYNYRFSMPFSLPVRLSAFQSTCSPNDISHPTNIAVQANMYFATLSALSSLPSSFFHRFFILYTVPHKHYSAYRYLSHT